MWRGNHLRKRHEQSENRRLPGTTDPCFS